jgi:hypothetical protein
MIGRWVGLESCSYNLKKMFCCFFGFFRFLFCRVLFFAECFSTLGNVFAECPKKVHGKEPFVDKIFAEYYTRQRLCRV